MTRDEAVRIVTLSNPTPYPQAFVQALEALGILKLDQRTKEPITLCGEDEDWNWWLSQSKFFKDSAVKTFRENLQLDESDVFKKLAYACAGIPSLATMIQNTVEIAGLKIVDK